MACLRTPGSRKAGSASVCCVELAVGRVGLGKGTQNLVNPALVYGACLQLALRDGSRIL